MCKAEIHMLKQLWPVMKQQEKVGTEIIMDQVRKVVKKGKTPRFFMYAANWCGNSENAFNHIQNVLLENLEDKSDHFTIVDVATSRYICPNDSWYTLIDKEKELASDLNVQLQQLMGCWQSVLVKKTKAFNTKPQVFIHTHPNWHYVGGADDTLKLTPIAANTQVSEGGSSDLIHLLPMVTKEAGNQPTQLKF